MEARGGPPTLGIGAARPKVVAALAARFRDLDLAEDAFADAALAALTAWKTETPRDPAAWLWRTALNKVLDAKRRAGVRAAHRPDDPAPPPSAEEALIMQADEPIPDERLRLIFVCCHPALAPDSRAALTLKTVCGLSTERLARAFLMAEPAMLQRITRAKQKIRAADLARSGPYQLTAAIHGAHLSRRETGKTPWSDIAVLYGILFHLRPDPVIAVNRAVAVGEADGAESGLLLLAEIHHDRLEQWLPWQAARAGLFAKAGRHAEARAAVAAALDLGPAPAERLFLQRRLAALA